MVRGSTQWPETQTAPDSNAMMAGELIRMCSEIRKAFTSTVSIQAECIATLAATNADLRADALDSYRAEVEAIAEASLVSTLAEIEADVEHPTDPLRDTAAQVMQGLAAQFLPGNGSPVNSKELILGALQADPGLLAELISDPDLVALAGDIENGTAMDGTPIPDVE